MNTNWKNELEGPVWVPYLQYVERMWTIPVDLLARVAYQESRFRLEIINGTKASLVGALGLMQMMPQFWASVHAPVPFTEAATKNQIAQAAAFLAGLYHRFGSWPEALAAYNFGPGNEEKYLEHKIAGLPKETQDYVREILADVPIQGASV